MRGHCGVAGERGGGLGVHVRIGQRLPEPPTPAVEVGRERRIRFLKHEPLAWREFGRRSTEHSRRTSRRRQLNARRQRLRLGVREFLPVLGERPHKLQPIFSTQESHCVRGS